ncbi:MAG: hypothetical protein A2672_00835 [Candidatus Wildermuthbacteria bacterium RIFCSPHIGHO2_01_FULL_49_22b]|uniref:Uncharacterized protein n=1 Tax=Candidatus Wildermuthbacteria bacterium RIFCSPHIGHO2_01_FULL_49_22b TaxID=1802448 RepID=A0A1G2QYH8_9BACT|nr:MAG: hypothetical protein A2672_00835 [Candidatus Wildermuthbacteria bacterium RIFCSPHIGHO2_01_FULL_49_22b]
MRRILPEGISLSHLSAVVDSFSEDIKKLLQHHIRIGTDSFNLCVVEGKPRIYFNDLGNARFATDDSGINLEETAEYYARAVVGVLTNGLTEAEYTEYKDYLEDHAEELAQRLKVNSLA